MSDILLQFKVLGENNNNATTLGDSDVLRLIGGASRGKV